MKLYYSPGACSLADHIALREAGVDFESESVAIGTKRTASGADFTQVTGKGYVPALVLDDGQLLTENIAILDHLTSLYPQLAPDGLLGRARQLEALAYISTEIHKSFKPLWHNGSAVEKDEARAEIAKQLQLLAGSGESQYLLGGRPTVADFYLFVIMLWAKRFHVPLPPRLAEINERLEARPAVQAALKAEGLR